MASALDSLIAFSKKQLTRDEVMRALVEHDDWFMPALYLPEEERVADSVVIYANEFSLPAEKLLVFTDRASMDQAVEKVGHKTLGIYAGKIKGRELFGRLERPQLSKIKELLVNPGVATERQWFVERPNFGLCAAWADAVSLERGILEPSGDMFSKLGNYEGFWVAIAKSDQTLVQVPYEGNAAYVFVFTAPDRYQQFVKSLGERASQVTSAVLPGKKLFPFLLGTKIDGMLLNGRMPFPRDTIELMATPM